MRFTLPPKRFITRPQLRKLDLQASKLGYNDREMRKEAKLLLNLEQEVALDCLSVQQAGVLIDKLEKRIEDDL